MASAPLDLIKDKMDKNNTDYKTYEEWGNNILTTAVFAIIITAPLGLILINSLGKRLLSKDEDIENITQINKEI